MKTTTWLRFAVICSSALALPAVAGPYTDDLAKCLVGSTTTAEKNTLMQWMFATAALHPDVKWMGTVSDRQRAKLNSDMTALIERLTQSCSKPMQQAVRYEGPNALEASFNVLGQVASRELFSAPVVATGLTEVSKHVDKDKPRKAFTISK